jgi:hypothetical protein
MQRKTAGYCKLCREKEVELYGKVLNSAGLRHEAACRAAGCQHPAWYPVTGQANRDK